MNERYSPKQIEPKWQERWEKDGIFRQYDRPEKFYVLDMFPYPSGAGLHVGHPRGYIATDVVARMKQLQGYGVLHPMGWDAFGLPAEQFAIKNKLHPSVSVRKNIETFKDQLGKIGFTYDWGREIDTTDPDYYRWTQWIFREMWKRGLAYESNEPINWCPSCQTGLANEDLEQGKCERCGTTVEKKPLRQWVLRMTAYADRLLADLDSEELKWSESIKEQQRHWIGRSEGAIVKFPLVIARSESSSDAAIRTEGLDRHVSPSEARDDNFVEVFTTRLDTIFGCTYVVVAPEHPLIVELLRCHSREGGNPGSTTVLDPRVKPEDDNLLKVENFKEIKEYLEHTKKKSDLERTELDKEKTGVKLEGIEAVNPFTGENVPVFVADYVLGSYGTGAVMAVPAHDERDWEFAKKYSLPITHVVLVSDTEREVWSDYHGEDLKYWNPELTVDGMTWWWKKDYCYTEDGLLFNSGQYNKLTSQQAREKMTAWLEEKGLGSGTVKYKMRDWTFSRQRYWGEPIPLVHCEQCGVVAVPEEELPVRLPDVESYEPTGRGESPLADIAEWVNTTCPSCGGPAKRETNTMPQWAGSCWYFLRYIDPKNDKALVDAGKEKQWMPVDLYVGGTEHATRHLLYARFWHKFLFDIGIVSTIEPFTRLVNQGLILAADGRKMSKRWGNVVNPDDMVADFGADAFRLYEMFLGPFGQSVAWSTDGVVGMRRFLERVWNLASGIKEGDEDAKNGKLETLLHQTVRKVTEDIEGFRFNTAISALMILANEMEKESGIQDSRFKILLILLSPFAPHIAEELWSRLGNEQSIFLESWPQYDPAKIVEGEITIAVQVNGRVRDQIVVPADISEDDLKRSALESGKARKFMEGRIPKKVIVVPGRLVSIVV